MTGEQLREEMWGPEQAETRAVQRLELIRQELGALIAKVQADAYSSVEIVEELLEIRVMCR